MMKTKEIESKLRELLAITDGPSVGMNPYRNIGVQLPKIQIKTFNGEPTEWRTFIEAFDATVHVRMDISYVEKFTYLKGFLSGT